MSDDNNFPRVWTKLKELEERLNILEDQLKVEGKEIADMPLKASEITVSQLRNGDSDISMTARISKIDAEKKAPEDSEKKWRFQVFTIGDYTGQIPLQLWDDAIDVHKDMNVGDIVKVTGAYIKEYKGNLQMRLSKAGTLKKVEEHIL